MVSQHIPSHSKHPCGIQGETPDSWSKSPAQPRGQTWGSHSGASVSLDEVQPGYTMGEMGTGMTQIPSQLVHATTSLGASLGKIHLAACWIKQLHFR